MPCEEVGILDELRAHIEAAGAPDRAVMHIGVFLAWCVNHDLISHDLSRRHPDLLIKVKIREIDGSDLLVKVAAGQLSHDLLSEAGSAFAKRYYDQYLQDYAQALGLDATHPYDADDAWSAYDKVAPVLTRRFRDSCASPVKSAVVNLFSRRRKRPRLRLVR